MKSRIQYLTKTFHGQVFLVICFFFIISFLLVFGISLKMNNNQFLVGYDQPIWFSIQHIYNNAFVRVSDSGGMSNGIQILTLLPTSIPYLVFFKLGFSLKVIQILLFFVLLFLIQVITFVGMLKLAQHYSKEQEERDRSTIINSILATLFYCFNLLTIIYFNGGIFWSVSSVLSYAFAPLAFYFLIKFLFSRQFDTRDSVASAIVMFMSAITLMFIVPLLFGFVVIVGTSLFLIKINYQKIKKMFLTLFLFLLMFSMFIIIIIFEAKFNTSNVITKNLENGMSGSIAVGIPYMFNHYFAWTLYNYWEPRNIVSFAKYYFSLSYLIPLFLLYFLIFTSFLKDKKLLKKSFSFLAVYLVALFFAKGSLPPLGFIYSYLINNFSIFLTIRTPDTKFGFLAMLSFSILLLMVFINTNRLKYKSIVIVLFLVCLVFINIPLITGEAFIGKVVPDKSGSIVTNNPVGTEAVVDEVNSDKTISNIIIYPPNSFPNVVHDGKLFTGREFLSSYISKPVLFEGDSRENADFENKLKNLFKRKDLSEIPKLNVSYIIIRKDFYIDKERKDAQAFGEEIQNSQYVSKIIDNQNYLVYKVKDEFRGTIISTSNSDVLIQYNKISPIKYEISLHNLRPDTNLKFAESYNKYWELYLEKNTEMTGMNGKPELYNFSDLRFFYTKDMFSNTHVLKDGSENNWKLDPNFIVSNFPSDFYEKNADGTINVTITMYYKPQIYFYLGLILSVMTFLSSIGYLIISRQNRKRKYENF